MSYSVFRRVLFPLLAVLVLCADTSAARAAGASDDNPAVTLVRQTAKYRFKRWLRNRVFDDSDEARYSLQVSPAAARIDPSLPLIIQVHGYNSTHDRNLAVLEPFKESGYPTAGFDYPNDHGIAYSAQRLARELKELARDQPDRRVILITHSMGGLVARACIEDEDLDPGNVDCLLMIAPPSHGTLIAHIAVATDLWEHWLGRDHGSPWTRWRDSVVDGLGEAADDLLPNSPFLRTLNARPRNGDVRYAIFLGTSAAFEEEEMQWLHNRLNNSSGRVPGLGRMTRKLSRLLEDMDELVEGKGDGIVAVKRGRLEGVDDTVLLPFGHLSVTGVAESEVVRQVQRELLARVDEGG